MLSVDGDADAAVEARIRIGWNKFRQLVPLLTSLQTDNHASTPPLSFLQAECPSCHPTNSVKALN